MPQTVHQEISKNIIAGVSITCLLVLISTRLPIIGFLSSWLIPLPVLFYRIKLGRNLGMVIPLAALSIIVAAGGGISADTLFFSGLMFLGFILAEFLVLNISIEKTVMFTCATVFFTGLLSLVIYSNITNTGITRLITGYVEENLKMTLSLYESMGMPEEKIVLISNALDTIKYLLVRILPGLTAAMLMFVAWINILTAGPVLRKKNLFFPDYGPLTLWKAPENLVWIAIAAGMVLLLPMKLPGIIGINIVIVLVTIYFFQGIAIIQFYFEKKKFPTMLRGILYALIAIQQLLLILVIGVGFFDTWVNFRRLGQEKKNRQ